MSLTTDNEPTQFYLTDALQSVVNLTNNQGAIQVRYQYDAWGNKRKQVGDSYNRFSFTGYEKDTETGLLYAKARFYDPDTGKFLSEDTWEGDNMIAPSLHRYLYAYQNPTVWVDPTGNYNEAGHYYTTFIVAMRVGYTLSEARELAFYSQVSDEVGMFDAHNLGIRALKSAVLDPGWKRRQIIEKGSRYTEGLHVLTGEDALKQRSNAEGLIHDYDDDIKLIGMAIHPLGDSYAHLQQGEGNNKTYHKIRGHAVDSLLKRDPDHIHRRPDLYSSHVKGLARKLAAIRGFKLVDEDINQIASDLVGLAESSKVVRSSQSRNAVRIDHQASSEKAIVIFRQESLKLIDARVNSNVDDSSFKIDSETLIHKPEDTSPIGVDEPLRDLKRLMKTQKGVKLRNEQIRSEFEFVKKAANKVADEMRSKLNSE